MSDGHEPEEPLFDEVVVPPLPENEHARLAALERYRLVGIGREPAFDNVATFAGDLFDMPFALVSIIGSEQQCIRGACGLGISTTPRDVAFCSYTILKDEVLVVPDATIDRRFRRNPFVVGPPHIGFYAGAPLVMKGGEIVGALCVMDTRPRDFDGEKARRLAKLARTVVDIIELRVERFAAERRRLELVEERQRLTLTVENVSEAVALFDADLRLIVWNESFVDLYDLPPELVERGMPVSVMIHFLADRGDLGQGDPDHMTQAFVASIVGTPARQTELRRHDGRLLDARRRSIAGGQFIVTARDVTDERQAARLKDELVSTVSHELRTPLTAISGALGLMTAGAAGALSPKAMQLATIGQKNAARLSELVNDLLDMDKVQSGKMNFHFAPRDLAVLVRDVVEQNHPYFDRFGVQVTLALVGDAMGGAPLIADVDTARIFQVLTNLLSNAAKFSPRGSTVTVTLRREGGQARISVSDRGPGISPEFRERLFTRFAQEDGAHQAGITGTGLGLAISKAIVDAHGGTIGLEPDGPPGATFSVRLPLEQAATTS